MKRLDKKQKARHEELSQKLTETHDELNEAILVFNAKVSALHAELLAPKVAAVNEVITAANLFAEEINAEQVDYYDERSDAWREGDAGSEYESWKDSWELELEELSLEEPTPLDEVDPDVEAFTNLETEVSS